MQWIKDYRSKNSSENSSKNSSKKFVKKFVKKILKKFVKKFIKEPQGTSRNLYFGQITPEKVLELSRFLEAPLVWQAEGKLKNETVLLGEFRYI